LLLANGTFWFSVENNIGRVEFMPTLLYMSMVLWLPALAALTTMRLFAEEKRHGTLETLLTAPVTEWEVVAGKYAGALSFVTLALALSAGSVYTLALFSPAMAQPDTGAMIGGGIVVFLIAAYCVAVGLLFSLLTRNQIVAAACGYVAMVLPPLFVGSGMRGLPFDAERLSRYLAVEDHLMDFTRGALDARPAVLYVSGAMLLLFCGTRILALRKL
jgi:ABC-2 type transport system permease protein